VLDGRREHCRRAETRDTSAVRARETFILGQDRKNVRPAQRIYMRTSGVRETNRNGRGQGTQTGSSWFIRGLRTKQSCYLLLFQLIVMKMITFREQRLLYSSNLARMDHGRLPGKFTLRRLSELKFHMSDSKHVVTLYYIITKTKAEPRKSAITEYQNSVVRVSVSDMRCHRTPE